MWRVGKSLTTVFHGNEPAAYCETPEIADRIVAAMNAAEASEAPKFAVACPHGNVPRDKFICAGCVADLPPSAAKAFIRCAVCGGEYVGRHDCPGAVACSVCGKDHGVFDCAAKAVCAACGGAGVVENIIGPARTERCPDCAPRKVCGFCGGDHPRETCRENE